MTAQAIEQRLCALRAVASSQDPIGSGGTPPRILAIEVATPWGEGFFEGDPAGDFRQRIWAARLAHIERLRASDRWEEILAAGIPALYGIAPDPEWSDPAMRRALLITRPAGPIAGYEIAEYQFPSDADDIVAFAETYLAAPDEIGRFEDYRVPHNGIREFFVCTHGSVDICCAKLGIPLYRAARDAYPVVRAWRTTHFGGHRYAPTAWEFPAGYRWGFLDDERTPAVLQRSGHPRDISAAIRGWSGVPPRVQLLDRAGLEHFGWPWLDFVRNGEVIEADEEARRWRARLDYETPSGQRGALEGVVTVAREHHEVGCGPHYGDYDFQVAEYQLESLDMR